MSSFIKFSVILALLSLVHSSSRGEELCHSVNQNPSNDPVTPLSLDPITINQNSCAKYFSLGLENPAFMNKYVVIEVNFHDFPEDIRFVPAFLQSMSSKPFLYFDVSSRSLIRESADLFDSNAFTNKKTYHHVVLSPEDVKNYQISYFALYKVFTTSENYSDIPLTYDIKVKISDTFPCPQDCSGNGVCNEEQKRCICDEGFFDLDCSNKATRLVLETCGTELLKPNSWGYFYLYVENDLNLKITTGKSFGSVEFSFLIEDIETYVLPNFYKTDGSYQLSAKENSFDLAITRKMGSENQNEGKLLIGVYNYERTPVTVNVQIDNFEDAQVRSMTLLYSIVIGSFVGLVMFWGTAILVKYRIYRQTGIWEEGSFVTLRKTDLPLTKQEVEKYFPKKKFEDLTSTFPQTLCSICLEDFQGDAMCRQLYCEHIYHDTCIEAWVIKQDNCPNCKKTMTKQAIEEFLVTPKPVKENYQAQVSIQMKELDLNVSTSQQPDNEQQGLLESFEKNPEFIPIVGEEEL